MLKVKINDNEAIPIPAKVAKKLALKDGAIIEARKNHRVKSSSFTALPCPCK